MIDVLFCCKGRPEFTEIALRQLVRTLEHSIDVRLFLYSDGDEMAHLRCGSVMGQLCNEGVHITNLEICNESVATGGPVGSWVHYLRYHSHEAVYVAKIDNDTVVPEGWLLAAHAVMVRNRSLGILGLEPWQSRTYNPERNRPVEAPEANDCPDGYAAVDSVGGVFFARLAQVKLRSYPQAVGVRGGFTAWQQIESTRGLKVGWIAPPLRLFLLDRLPIEPYRSLSTRYEDEGIQRPWTKYDRSRSNLWSWFTNAQTR